LVDLVTFCHFSLVLLAVCSYNREADILTLVCIQVTGYVLLAFIYNTDAIPLTNLRVIRGNTLYQVPNDPTNIGYSLYVSNNYLKSRPGAGVKELQLTSLHGV